MTIPVQIIKAVYFLDQNYAIFTQKFQLRVTITDDWQMRQVISETA